MTNAVENYLNNKSKDELVAQILRMMKQGGQRIRTIFRLESELDDAIQKADRLTDQLMAAKAEIVEFRRDAREARSLGLDVMAAQRRAVNKLQARVNSLETAIKEIDQTLQVHVSEYAPAIRDAFDTIDRVMKEKK